MGAGGKSYLPGWGSRDLMLARLIAVTMLALAATFAGKFTDSLDFALAVAFLGMAYFWCREVR